MRRHGFGFLVAMAVATPALGAEKLPQFATDAEYRYLPVACRPGNLLNAVEVQEKNRIFELLGDKVTVHLRHYCNGLNNLSRAQITFDKKDKHLYLVRAVREFNYCLTAWPKNGPLNAEAESKKRQAEALLAVIGGGVPR